MTTELMYKAKSLYENISKFFDVMDIGTQHLNDDEKELFDLIDNEKIIYTHMYSRDVIDMTFEREEMTSRIKNKLKELIREFKNL